MLLFVSYSVSAQLFPERRQIRSGNVMYENKQWGDALRRYGTALALNPSSWEAATNLGSTLYRMGQYAQADSLYSQVTKHPLLTPKQRARVFYNLGNDQFQAKQYDKAVESYKNSLRLNSEDMEAKFNLAYAQKMLENQQQHNNNQEQNRDKQQNQQDRNDENQQQDNQPQNEQQRISREDAEKLLKAMQQQENNTAERIKAEEVEKRAGQRGKNW